MANPQEYRFGFQGQEKDNEWTGTEGSHLAFKYRIHDARIGRFLSIDPLTAKYSHNSPYAFSENRVIDMIELEGAETFRPFLLRPIGMNNTSRLLENSRRIELENPDASQISIASKAAWQTTVNPPHREVYEALPLRFRMGTKGTFQIVSGMCGTLGGLMIIGGSAFIATPAGLIVVSLSWSTVYKGFRNLGYAIEGGSEDLIPTYNTYAGDLAEDLGANETTAKYIDIGASITSGSLAKPVSVGVDFVNVTSTALSVKDAAVEISKDVQNNANEDDGSNTNEKSHNDSGSSSNVSQQYLDKDVKNHS